MAGAAAGRGRAGAGAEPFSLAQEGFARAPLAPPVCAAVCSRCPCGSPSAGTGPVGLALRASEAPIKTGEKGGGRIHEATLSPKFFFFLVKLFRK